MSDARRWVPELKVKLTTAFPTEGHATYYATWVARQIEKEFGPNVRVEVEVIDKEGVKK